MAVGMIGAVGFSNTSIAHAAARQSAQAVVADRVLEGPGLDAALLDRARALPGATAAAGISSLSLMVTDSDLEPVGGAAVTGGSLDRLLDLDVVAGGLTSLGAGQIAVSTVEAAGGELGVHLGSTVTVYLPDGTPYRATVSALYARSLALGDVLIPGSVAAGHTGRPAAYDQILVGGAPAAAGLAALAAAHPGVRVADRQVYDAQVVQNQAQDDFGNGLILGVMSVLAAITMINTLIVATLERRRQVRLLARVGATGRQLAGMFAWQALFVTVCGVAAGALVAAGTLYAVVRASTGGSTPYIPLGPAVLVVGTVAALAGGAIMGAFRLLPRR
jgi:putative ABC transport system permease protein